MEAATAGSEINQALRANWRILVAAMTGWALDAFDFTMLLFLIPHLREVFDASLPQMALVVTATGLAKVVGTVVFGAAADRFGRKLPFMVAVIWFSLFCGLSGLAWSYLSFLLLRILFGIGFGGEWSASAPLLMETLPPKARPIAAGIMMAGYELGYFISAFCFFAIFPVLGWRWMFLLGVLPALLSIFIRSGVQESPDWLERRSQKRQPEKLRVTPAVVQGWAFMGAVNFMLWAVFALYPTFLISARGLSPAGVFPFVAIYSVTSIIGKPLAGYVAERFGERPMLLCYLLLTVPCTLLYTLIDTTWAMVLGAILMGLVANSAFGIVPMYLTRRFPADARGLGVGIGYAMTSLRRRALRHCCLYSALGSACVDDHIYHSRRPPFRGYRQLPHGALDSGAGSNHERGLIEAIECVERQLARRARRRNVERRRKHVYGPCRAQQAMVPDHPAGRDRRRGLVLRAESVAVVPRGDNICGDTTPRRSAGDRAVARPDAAQPPRRKS
ncbi:MAG: MFS transporter [Acetobacteraceae bacterium]|nr:MFS transporter [Acetobacteraceae bacterium]